MRHHDIYRLEVLDALENDRDLEFKKSRDGKYLSEGVCPGCGKRTAYIATAKPFQIACNRLNECRFTESTRERYSYLFENLSERFPRTPENPNATADAYLQRNRGFDITKLAGWYSQARRKLKNEQYADTVRFPLCDGHWERIIDAKAVAANENDKAGIKYGMSYKGKGWMPPGQVINRSDRVYIVEGIFHAIALHLAGYKVIASISANNFPWEVVEGHQGMLITCWIGNEWHLVDYFGGLTVYNTQTAEPMQLEGMGPIPNGYTLKKPGPSQVWRNGEWVDDIEAVLNKLFSERVTEFADATAQYLTGGFDSHALGERHHYGSLLEDQVNLIGLTLANDSATYPCTDSNHIGAFRPHSVEQIHQVGADLSRFKRQVLEHGESLRLNLVAALQAKDVERLREATWSPPQ